MNADTTPGWPRQPTGSSIRVHLRSPAANTSSPSMPRSLRSTLALSAALAIPARAQAPTLAPEVRQFVSVDAPVVALTRVRVIDGTGAPARANQTVVIERGTIRAVGDSATVAVPAGARVIDLAG